MTALLSARGISGTDRRSAGRRKRTQATKRKLRAGVMFRHGPRLMRIPNSSCHGLSGDRGAACAHRFMQDVASRIKNRIQLTTDGYKAYFDAVEDSFLGEIDYAILHKIYGTPPNEAGSRYSPAKTLRVTPAMAAGLTDHVWEIEEIVSLLDANVVSVKRGPYKKRTA